MNSYFLKVTSADRNEVAVSPCVGCDDNSVNLLVYNLDKSSFYNFTINSNNSVGEQSTTAASFCKQYISILNFLDNYISFKLLCHWVQDCTVYNVV